MLGAREVNLPSRDAAFLEKVQEAIEANLGEANFGVDALAEAVAMSRRQLLRKLRALTGETPIHLIRWQRLERAALLLRQDTGSVKEVAYATGFNSLRNFRRAFREAYGASPSEYAEAASAPFAPTSRSFLSQNGRTKSRKSRSEDATLKEDTESGLQRPDSAQRQQALNPD